MIGGRGEGRAGGKWRDEVSRGGGGCVVQRLVGAMRTCEVAGRWCGLGCSEARKGCCTRMGARVVIAFCCAGVGGGGGRVGEGGLVGDVPLLVGGVAGGEKRRKCQETIGPPARYPRQTRNQCLRQGQGEGCGEAEDFGENS